MKTNLIVLLLSLFITLPSWAQQDPRPGDVDTVENLVTALYDAYGTQNGSDFDWNRIRTLFHPNAILMPNIEQRQGSLDALTLDEFQEWIDSATTQLREGGGSFLEIGYHTQVDRYGNIANVMSSYKKYLNGELIPQFGINSIQMVFNQDRWWITGIAWDETYSGGPIPDKYGGTPDS